MRTSLPQRSEHVAAQLTAIANVVRELVGDDLAMLILFGSYARGDWVSDRYVEGDIIYSYQSDFDLLVVTEDRATPRWKVRPDWLRRSSGDWNGLDLTGPAPR